MTPGQRVNVVRGPYRGQTGIVVKISPANTLGPEMALLASEVDGVRIAVTDNEVEVMP